VPSVRSLLAIALAGFFLGPIGDQIHVRTGTLSYAHPWLLGQAWWVGPQFAIAFVLIGVGGVLIDRQFHQRLVPSHSAPVAIQIIGFVGAYLLSGLLHDWPWAVAALLVTFMLVRALPTIGDPDRAMLVTGLVLLVGGTVYEAIMSEHRNAFTYEHPHIGGAPIWLPLLYASGAPLAIKLARRVSRNARGENAEIAELVPPAPLHDV